MTATTSSLQMFARPQRVVPALREGLVVVYARRPAVAYQRFLDDTAGREWKAGFTVCKEEARDWG